MVRLRLPGPIARLLMEHADQEAPRECCGLLGGRQGLIEHHYPLPNTAREPERRYFADPAALVRALKAIRESGEELLGIYHSHPRCSPEPSPTDIHEAFYPDCAYFIVGPHRAKPRLRAFRIAGGEAVPVAFTWTRE